MSRRPSLLDEVRGLLTRATEVYRDTPNGPVLAGERARLAEPLRVAIAGKTKAGKSTLLNALVGEALAPTGAGECTQVVTWYRHGPRYRAWLRPRGRAVVETPLRRSGTGIEVDLGGRSADEVELVVVEW